MDWYDMRMKKKEGYERDKAAMGGLHMNGYIVANQDSYYHCYGQSSNSHYPESSFADDVIFESTESSPFNLSTNLNSGVAASSTSCINTEYVTPQNIINDHRKIKTKKNKKKKKKNLCNYQHIDIKPTNDILNDGNRNYIISGVMTPQDITSSSMKKKKSKKNKKTIYYRCRYKKSAKPVKADIFNNETCSGVNNDTRRNLQVVIMADSMNDSLCMTKMLEIKNLLVREIHAVSNNKQYREPILNIVGWKELKTQWLLLECGDEFTMKWLLNWRLLKNMSFKAVEAAVAPWKACRICIGINEKTIDIDRVMKGLNKENPDLKVDQWKYLETVETVMTWDVHFLIAGDVVRIFEEIGWEVFYLLNKLRVTVLLFGS